MAHYHLPIKHMQQPLRDRYEYRDNEPLALFWREPSINAGKPGGHWIEGNPRIRRIAAEGHRYIPLARAVWVFHHGTQPPDFLKPDASNPEDYRIENLKVQPRPKESRELRVTKNLANLEAWKHSHTPEEWKAKQRDMNFRRNYGISTEQYAEMYRAQAGKCAICGHGEMIIRRNGNLSVDHCHITKKIRALLCSRCNQGIGLFKENEHWLRRAAEYLESHA